MDMNRSFLRSVENLLDAIDKVSYEANRELHPEAKILADMLYIRLTPVRELASEIARKPFDDAVKRAIS